MGFYDDSKNVDKYIEMCNDYDGRHIYNELKKILDGEKSVLELGSGPGSDIPFLNAHYKVTGLDLSEEFISRLKNKYQDIPFLKINAMDIDIKDKFDCIFFK